MNFRDYLLEEFMTPDEIEAHNKEEWENRGKRKRENHANFPEQFKEGTRIAEVLSDKYGLPIEYDYFDDDYSKKLAFTINDEKIGTSFFGKDEEEAEKRFLSKLKDYGVNPEVE